VVHRAVCASFAPASPQLRQGWIFRPQVIEIEMENTMYAMLFQVAAAI
jgi:hypothetical protein